MHIFVQIFRIFYLLHQKFDPWIFFVNFNLFAMKFSKQNNNNKSNKHTVYFPQSHIRFYLLSYFFTTVLSLYTFVWSLNLYFANLTHSIVTTTLFFYIFETAVKQINEIDSWMRIKWKIILMKVKSERYEIKSSLKVFFWEIL